MKAMTLQQPWATLVAIGAKHYETRSWRTEHRGPLAIHASKALPKNIGGICSREPFWSTLRPWLDKMDFPTGAVIAVVTLLNCLPTEQYQHKPYSDMLSKNERAFGDWTPGRWSWQLADMQMLPDPIPAKGALGLWEWTPPEGFNL